MAPEQFPTLRQHAKDLAGFDTSLANLAAGMEAGQIRNAVLQDIKQCLGQAVYYAWGVEIGDKEFHRNESQHDRATMELYYRCSVVMNLHDVLAVHRKLHKSPLQTPGAQTMRKLIAQALPLAEAVVALKDQVVKGRAPSTSPNAQPVNPDKVVMTCPCCFRQIAVVNSKMTHHGYTRPGTGQQSASCYGIRFPPLETSLEGLQWLIEHVTTQLDDSHTAYKGRHDRTELHVLRHRKLLVLTKDHPDWRNELGQFIANLENKIRSLTALLAQLKAALAKWQEFHEGHNHA